MSGGPETVMPVDRLRLVSNVVGVLRPLNPAIAYLALLGLLQDGSLTRAEAQSVLDACGLALRGYELPELATVH